MVSFLFFDSLPSTMDEARSCVLQGAEEGLVIVAHQQTQGRGRRGRVWEAFLGNLCLTYITYLESPLSVASNLSFVSCVAVGEALRSFLFGECYLSYKWPNDLLLNGKKVCGILLESVPTTLENKVGYLIGCGVNLVAYPLQARYPATSFQMEGVFLNYEDVLHKIAFSLQHYIALWQNEGFSGIYSLWMQYATGVESTITVDLQGEKQEGVFKGIDETGALVLETAKGLIKLSAGEVVGESRRVIGN